MLVHPAVMSLTAEEELVRALGAAIAARRRELGLSQGQVAERLHMGSPESLSRYERGEREPRCTTLARIAGALETRPSELMKAMDPKPRGSFNRVVTAPQHEDTQRAIQTHLTLLSHAAPWTLPAILALVEGLVERSGESRST